MVGGTKTTNNKHTYISSRIVATVNGRRKKEVSGLMGRRQTCHTENAVSDRSWIIYLNLGGLLGFFCSSKSVFAIPCHHVEKALIDWPRRKSLFTSCRVLSIVCILKSEEQEP